MRVNVLMRGVKCKNGPFHRKNGPFHRKNPPFHRKTAILVQKTGKVSDWYQSDNYL